MNHKYIVTGGLEAALGRKEQVNRHRKIDGRVEARIIAIACSEAPEGRERWTLQLIADELVWLGVVDSISDTVVMETLKLSLTPIHASWLNMAEIEIGILSRQCLSQSLPSFELMAHQVNAWTLHRNAVCSTVHWRFSTISRGTSVS